MPKPRPLRVFRDSKGFYVRKGKRKLYVKARTRAEAQRKAISKGPKVYPLLRKRKQNIPRPANYRGPKTFDYRTLKQIDPEKSKKSFVEQITSLIQTAQNSKLSNSKALIPAGKSFQEELKQSMEDSTDFVDPALERQIETKVVLRKNEEQDKAAEEKKAEAQEKTKYKDKPKDVSKAKWDKITKLAGDGKIIGLSGKPVKGVLGALKTKTNKKKDDITEEDVNNMLRASRRMKRAAETKEIQTSKPIPESKKKATLQQQPEPEQQPEPAAPADPLPSNVIIPPREEEPAEQESQPSDIDGSGKKQALSALWNYQIDAFFKNEPKFTGTYSIDEIKDIPKQIPQGFIINTAPSNKPGEHWVACYISEDSIEYYDPFGEKPPAEFIKQIKQKLENREVPHMMKMKINTIKGQNDDTDHCGYFCLRFLQERFEGTPFKDATRFKKPQAGGHKIVDLSEKGEESIKKEFSLI